MVQPVTQPAAQPAAQSRSSTCTSGKPRDFAASGLPPEGGKSGRQERRPRPLKEPLAYSDDKTELFYTRAATIASKPSQFGFAE